MGRPVKLSDEQVFQIRENKEKKTNEELALYFDVSVPTISNVKAKKGAYAFDLKATPEGQEA